MPPQQRRTVDDGPTLGEVSRQLAEVALQLRELVASLDKTYVRRAEHDLRLKAVEERQAEQREDLEAIVEQQRQNRRLAVSGIVLPILSGIILALLLAALLPSGPM